MDDDAPPSYVVDDNHPLPVYSSTISSTECLLQIEPRRMTGCPACDWMFETKHMRINLGPRLWNLSSPSYGLNGRIEGSVRLAGEQDRMENVTVTLEGRVRITLSQRSTMSGDILVSQTTTIYDSTKADSFLWGEENPFSIPIPSQTDFKGHLTTLPPSHFSYHQFVSTEVFYTLKFQLCRKGKGLKRHESKIIRILYLPKSTPPAPPLHSIPRPSNRHVDATDFLRSLERVKTVSVAPYHPILGKNEPKRSSNVSLDVFGQCVFLSVPDPQCYASGQNIPFSLSLVFPDDPVLAHLLTKNIRIQLLKRLKVWKKGVSDVTARDTVVSTAALWYGREYTEGVTLLKGSIKTGDPGKEVSWRIDDTAEIQYVLRVSLKPPDNLVGYVPSFKHEEVLNLTTDSWGILNRELSSTGGTPTPAIGLAAGLRRNV